MSYKIEPTYFTFNPYLPKKIGHPVSTTLFKREHTPKMETLPSKIIRIRRRKPVPAPVPSSEGSEDCLICNTSMGSGILDKKPITCPYCQKTVCRICIQKYIIGTIKEPHCMFPDCQRFWSRDFLSIAVSPVFLNNEYKKHRQTVLVTREKSYLPGLMEKASFAKRANSLKKEIDEHSAKVLPINRQIKPIQDAMISLRCDIVKLRKDLKDATKATELTIVIAADINKKNVVFKKLKKEYHELNNSIILDKYLVKIKREDIQMLEHGKEPLKRSTEGVPLEQERWNGVETVRFPIGMPMPMPAGAGEVVLAEDPFKEKPVKKIYNTPCPANDCRGFLNEEYQCGLCSLWTCKKCMEIIGNNKKSNHTCNPHNIASVMLMKKDSRNCPGSGCGVQIYRIDGCPQMWCPQCHTAFDFNTGDIVKNTTLIHNPHYYEYLAATGAIAGPAVGPLNPCHANDNRVRNGFTNLLSIDINFHSYIINIWRFIIQEQDYNKRPEEPIPQSNEDIGIKYLIGEMTEKHWRELLLQREKDYHYRVDLFEIKETLLVATKDIIDECVGSFVENNTPEYIQVKIKDLQKHLDFLREMTNNSFTKNFNYFQRITPWIVENKENMGRWDFRTMKHTIRKINETRKYIPFNRDEWDKKVTEQKNKKKEKTKQILAEFGL